MDFFEGVVYIVLMFGASAIHKPNYHVKLKSQCCLFHHMFLHPLVTLLSYSTPQRPQKQPQMQNYKIETYKSLPFYTPRVT